MILSKVFKFKNALTYTVTVFIFKGLTKDQLLQLEWYNDWWPYLSPYKKNMEHKEYYRVVTHSSNNIRIFIDPS